LDTGGWHFFKSSGYFLGFIFLKDFKILEKKLILPNYFHCLF
jgi:hypothetical protein